MSAARRLLLKLNETELLIVEMDGGVLGWWFMTCWVRRWRVLFCWWWSLGSLNAVNLILQEEECWEEAIVHAVRELVLLRQLTLQFVPRSANQVAHRISKFSLLISGFSLWEGSGLPRLMEWISGEYIIVD